MKKSSTVCYIFHFYVNLNTPLSKLNASEIKLIFQIKMSVYHIKVETLEKVRITFCLRKIQHNFL